MSQKKLAKKSNKLIICYNSESVRGDENDS